MIDPMSQKSHLSINLLFGIVILTTPATGWLGLFTFKSADKLMEIQKQTEEIVRLQGLVTHYDEVLTTSSWMAAATGNIRWEKRYREFEPLLEQTLKKLISLQPNEIKSAEATDAANIALVEIEKKAIKLVQEHKPAQASQLLFSAEYEKQKELYSRGTSEFYKTIHRDLGYKQKIHRERVTKLRRALLFSLAISLFGWVFVFQKVRGWNQELSSMNERLDHKVKEQTAQLLNTAKMSALGAMAGGVAHEINTPLAIIGMQAEQMEECIKEGEINTLEFLDAVGVIKNTVDRIATIVSGLKFFARGGATAAPQTISISRLIEETLSFCGERFSNHGIQLEVVKNKAYETANIECRAVEISQVLLNLLNNSYDAVESLQEKWVRIEAAESGEYVVISVTDSGGGIPRAIQDQIMQPFFTTKEIGKGTGLGLSISNGILGAHQGKIYVDNDCPNTKIMIVVPKIQSKISNSIQEAA